MRTLHAHFYLEVLLSILLIPLGMYLLRNVFWTSSQDTFPSLLVGAVVLTGGVILAWWSIKAYAAMKSWDGGTRTAGHHGPRMRGKS